MKEEAGDGRTDGSGDGVGVGDLGRVRRRGDDTVGVSLTLEVGGDGDGAVLVDEVGGGGETVVDDDCGKPRRQSDGQREVWRAQGLTVLGLAGGLERELDLVAGLVARGGDRGGGEAGDGEGGVGRRAAGDEVGGW